MALEVHLTGFGAFRNVPINPVEIVVKEIEENFAHVVDNYPAGTTRHGTHYLPQARPVQHVILLHLGVDASRDYFAFEKQAWNDASFRIPDEEGWMPKGVRIREEDGPVTCTRQTSLDLDRLSQLLRGRGYCAAVSHDPGRFVCNWVYYQSLCHVGDYAAHMGDTRADVTHTDDGMHADVTRALAASRSQGGVVSEHGDVASVSASGLVATMSKEAGSGGQEHFAERGEGAPNGGGVATLVHKDEFSNFPACTGPVHDGNGTIRVEGTGHVGDHDAHVLNDPRKGHHSCRCRGHASPDVCVRMESLFVHMPPFECIPKAKQVEFVGALMEELAGVLV
eukprot:jgi/Mesvir1/24318/Mv11004-RA.3